MTMSDMQDQEWKSFALYPLVIQPLVSRRLCFNYDVLLCSSILSHTRVKSIPLPVISIY